ncbi:hypothetical protein [Bacillus altitudinis]|uniref:hypothetical protein n=1 Tax=Bacillus altitudinis TaxID=293387 RepID=UPI0020D03896|nr:hypothetical protein [Bacillus altitudinis]
MLGTTESFYRKVKNEKPIAVSGCGAHLRGLDASDPLLIIIYDVSESHWLKMT